MCLRVALMSSSDMLLIHNMQVWTSKASQASHAQAATLCVACTDSADCPPCVQSFYEEQKREQMQGPVLKRLEEEQQQQAQAPPLADDQWQHTQYTIGQDQQDPAHQQGLPFDESQLPFDQSNSPFDEATGQDDSQQGSLQLNGPRSWAGTRQSHQPHMPVRPTSSEGLPLGMAGSFSGVSTGARGSKAHASPKPPLPGRRQRTQSSEMAYLGGSAGNSVGSGSDSDHV